MLGVFFFIRLSTFQVSLFDGSFFHHLKDFVVLNSNLKRYFTCDDFSTEANMTHNATRKN